MSWKRQKYLLSFWNISRSKICYCRLCNKILLQRKFTKIFFLFCCPKAHLDVVSSSDLRVYSQHCLPSMWSGTKVGGSCQQYLARAEKITYFFSIKWLSPPDYGFLLLPSSDCLIWFSASGNPENLDLEPLCWDRLLTRLTITTPLIFLLSIIIITICRYHCSIPFLCCYF